MKFLQCFDKDEASKWEIGHITHNRKYLLFNFPDQTPNWNLGFFTNSGSFKSFPTEFDAIYIHNLNQYYKIIEE